MVSIWDLINRIFGSDQDNAEAARDRLKAALHGDRVKISPETMEEMKRELIKAVSDYLEIDPEKLELKVDQEGKASALVANIPLKGGRKSIEIRKKLALELDATLAESATEQSTDTSKNGSENSDTAKSDSKKAKAKSKSTKSKSASSKKSKPSATDETGTTKPASKTRKKSTTRKKAKKSLQRKTKS